MRREANDVRFFEGSAGVFQAVLRGDVGVDGGATEENDGTARASVQGSGRSGRREATKRTAKPTNHPMSMKLPEA